MRKLRLEILILALTMFLVCPDVFAQWVQTNGPYGGFMWVLAMNGTSLLAGTQGGVWRSADDGDLWGQVNVGLTSTIVRAFAVSGTNIFAGTIDGGAGSGYGRGGVFLSTNNGSSWIPINSGLTSTSALAFAVRGNDVFVGTAVLGTAGGVFRSSDNGANWTGINGGWTPISVYSLAIMDTNLFAGTRGGGVYVLRNVGASWASTGLTYGWVNALAVNGSNIFAGTDTGGVFRSTNGGSSWIQANVGLTSKTVRAFAVSGSRLFCGTSGGGVFLSIDNGASWAPFNIGSTQSSIWALATSGSYLFAGTGDGFVWRRSLSDALPVQIASLTAQICDGNLVQLVWTTVSEINNYGFEVQRSLDGKIFVSIAGSFVPGNGTTNESHTYSYVDVAPSGTTSYRIKQTDLDGTVSFSEAIQVNTTTDVKEEKPAVFGLDQNYPNPFNPSTTIRYGLPARSHVTLTVFNTLGQQVAGLQNGEQEAGYHEVRFDASEMASGVYFYRIQAGAYVETRKLLLIK